MPPPIFADSQNNTCQVPMPPPPPKNSKPHKQQQSVQSNQNLIISPNHLQQVDNLSKAGSSTIKKSMQHNSQSQTMEELRV
jgi:hypothetical protein